LEAGNRCPMPFWDAKWRLPVCEKLSNTLQYGYFRNKDDVLWPEIDIRRHFEIQDGDFRFVENCQISYNMGILVTGKTCRGRQSMSDAFLKSKMATYGL